MKTNKFTTLFLISFLIFSSYLSEKLFAQVIQLGLGTYSTVLPPNSVGPSNFQGAPVNPKVSPSFNQPVQTNDYWSSLIFPFYGSQYSNTIYVLPLVVKAYNNGLGMGYTKDPVYAAADYLYPYQQQLVVGPDGMNAPKTTVDSYGDWTVTAFWDDGTRTMKATFGHGLPYTYYTITGGNAKIVSGETPVIWSNQNGVVGLTVAGRHYGIFGPTGSVWNGTTTLTSTLNGKNYFSVAILPDNTPATLEYYRKRAYAFVTDSRVSWSYSESQSKLTSVFTYSTTLKDSAAGNLNNTITALYRHQWLNTNAPLTSYSYVSVRGEMKIYDGNEFSTVLDYNGILPSLPDEGVYNPAILKNLIQTVAAESLSRGPIYENGKAIARFAAIVRIADQMGKITERDYFIAQIKKRLEAWFTVGGGDELSLISRWNTVSAYPSGYGADNQLNDHNFHYGYLIMAAATVAQYDPVWAAPENWGQMVNLLIKDCVNWNREDTAFPYLRSFDPYEGHSWEAGHGDFGDGNNEESSSESMNFSAAVALWGAVTQNTVIRDLGIFLYSNERAAIEQYWFDIDDAVFPAPYQYKALGMIWGGKGVHSTWFGADPEFIHGINFLPITGASLYLGRDTGYVLRNYNEMVSEIGSLPRKWKDIMWKYLSFADPQTALNQYYADPGYEPFDGETRAATYHWLGNMRRMGQLNTQITADIPTYAVFTNSDQFKTYVAYNPGTASRTVNFSDGYSMTVPDRQMKSFHTDTASALAPVSVPISNVSSGKVPLTVQFKGSNSFDRNGQITAYKWSFGDSSYAYSADTSHLYTSPGVYKATLTVTNDAGLTGRADITITVKGNGTAYNGSPINLPGVVEAEEYDLGGEGVAYHDSDPRNNGIPFRPNEGVDIEGCGDIGGGYDVGWIVTGEWMEYTVNVTQSGYYDITARTASVPGGGAYHIEFNGVNVTGRKSVPVTGGWQFWTDVVTTAVYLNQGQQVMRFAIEGSEFNLNKITITRNLTGTGDDENNHPREFSLAQNYPNPFNPSTTIMYSVPRAERVMIKVYDINGSETATLVDEIKNPGHYSSVFDGSKLSSGIYFIRMDAGAFSKSHKMILLK